MGLRILELYSGIGGMHHALNDSAVGDVVTAVEINTIANKVYKENFPKTTLWQRNILSVTKTEIDSLNIDTILMSPPCQPFTRVGLKKDVTDERTQSFLHVLKLIPHLRNLKYVLVENVKGFEISEARECLVTTLKEANFDHREFILSPSQFGIPNSRHRYYLLAKRKPLSFIFDSNCILESFPFVDISNSATDEVLSKLKQCIAKHSRNNYILGHIVQCYPLSEVLDANTDKKFLLSDTVLLKYRQALDITTTESRRSCCFTKAYGHYLVGTGSVLSTLPQDKISSIFEQCKDCEKNSEYILSLLKKLELRYFTPGEIAQLMCFPSTFHFPDDITVKQMYRLLGNSINVYVVSMLILLLVCGDEIVPVF